MTNFYPRTVKTLPDYRLLITFDNHERRIFDVKPYLQNKFFAPLNDRGVFAQARVNQITVEFPGEIDFCPDELYANSTPEIL